MRILLKEQNYGAWILRIKIVIHKKMHIFYGFTDLKFLFFTFKLHIFRNFKRKIELSSKFSRNLRWVENQGDCLTNVVGYQS